MTPHLSSPFLSGLSQLSGWIYVFCWCASFYPQPFLNWQRRSTTGITIDFPVLNTFGFMAYTISTSVFLYSPLIREQYAARNHGLTPTVQFNDLAFAVHSFLMSLVVWSQFYSVWGFDKGGRRGPGGKISSAVKGIMLGTLIAVAVVCCFIASAIGLDAAVSWDWIDAIYAISYAKVVVTIVKYCPQVLMNYKRKSTRGFSIAQMILDFTGGLLSNAQLGIDSYLQNDWSGVWGNPVKLLLANLSIFFDIVFFFQYFWLYRGAENKIEDADIAGQYDPLLGRDPTWEA